MSNWNGNRFSIYTSEEKSALKLMEELGKQTEENMNGLKGKTDLYGDHKGSWQGLSKPTLSDEGMRATVEKHMTDISNLQDKDILTDEEINNLKESDTATRLEIEDIKQDIVDVNKLIEDNNVLINDKIANIKGNVVYMKDFPKNTADYSTVLNPLTNTTKTVILICDAETEYIFKTPLIIKGRLRVIGNGCSWRYLGGNGSKFIQYTKAPWLTEGLTFEGVSLWCGSGNVPYQNITAVEMQGNHINVKFTDCRFYNFGYCVIMARTDDTFTFGHSFIDCSFWGFINAIKSDGNAEQVLIQHCWFDDGQRGDGTTNAAIRITDVSSFWINNNIIQNCDIGISVRGGYNVSIRENHFENMIDSSIWFYPASAYENRTCVVDNNFLVGGKCCVKFLTASGRKSVHCTFSNNFAHFLGTSATHMFFASNTGACDYGVFFNNSLRPEIQAEGKQIMNSNVTNCLTGFQTS